MVAEFGRRRIECRNDRRKTGGVYHGCFGPKALQIIGNTYQKYILEMFIGAVPDRERFFYAENIKFS